MGEGGREREIGRLRREEREEGKRSEERETTTYMHTRVEMEKSPKTILSIRSFNSTYKSNSFDYSTAIIKMCDL